MVLFQIDLKHAFNIWAMWAPAPELEYYDLQKFCGGKNCMLPPQVKMCGGGPHCPHAYMKNS